VLGGGAAKTGKNRLQGRAHGDKVPKKSCVTILIRRVYGEKQPGRKRARREKTKDEVSARREMVVLKSRKKGLECQKKKEWFTKKEGRSAKKENRPLMKV